MNVVLRVLGSLLLCAVLLAPASGMAQTRATGAALTQQEVSDWETLTTRAEDVIGANRASDDALETLRAQLASARERFTAARSVNAGAIETVLAQIDALGPKPDEGEEPPAVAEQRETLEARLAELRAPVLQADVAYSVADAQIRVIDALLRERQADELMEIGPSPLNPANWPGAVTELSDFLLELAEETRASWSDPQRRDEVLGNLPTTLLLLVVALLMVLRGRGWIERMGEGVEERRRTAERWLLGFVMSLGQIVIPVGGLIALSAAVSNLGLTGTVGDALIAALPEAGFVLFVSRWLGGRIFGMGETSELTSGLDRARRREGRVFASALGVVVFLAVLIDTASGAAGWSPGTQNIVYFPLLVVAGLMIMRLSRLLVLHTRSEQADEEEQSFRLRVLMLLGRAMSVLAVLAPTLAAIGYFKAGQQIGFSTIFSLQLIALLVILQRVINELYVLVTRNRQGVNEALLPVLLGFGMALASVPIFALIWGARSTDLTEIWTQVRTGFTIGDTTISPTDFFLFIIVFAIGYIITKMLQGALKSTVLPKTGLDLGGQNAVVSGTGYVGIFLAALIAITTAGIDLSSLAIVAGALSVGIGFGLQTIVSNFVSGIILLIERPISEGDWIEVGGNMGFVRDISVRSTRIETFDRTDVIVPNADLVSGTVTNWTRGNMVGRLIVPVGVAYGTDTRRVEAILQEIAEAQPIVLLNPPPYVYFKGFGGDSLDFEIRAILRDITQMLVVQTEMNHQIAERFAREGIEIPFAQRDIWLRNPEALHPAAPRVEAVSLPGGSAGAAAAGPADPTGKDET
ncbi:DUF3772 domain-containing protein [Pseudooceanicola aestuarii]|uniref:DUF3772 domain-containing protein n=1 Tax=Pseudooceanicola aestuarii TaxID=2697319 RepID=UPI0013D02CC7|nr:DUF3772 domain-containing protein [Pseudooceanicola aestuarii]